MSTSVSGEVSIVGARGFVGARLVRHFEAQGGRVHAYGRGDEARLMADAHGSMYYCAGFTGDYADDPAGTVEAHAGLISRVIAAARFERLVYCSSTRLYDSAGVALAHEDTPLVFSPENPRHLYDLSKALGENLCLNDPQKRCVVARISNVFDLDPQASGFLMDWLRAAQKSTHVELASSPHFGRDYIHVDDVVSALVAIVASKAAGIFNAASGRVTRNAEIAAELEKRGILTRFSSDALAAPMPIIATARMQALGVHARDTRDIFVRNL